MPRNINDVMGKTMPAPGDHTCKCVDVGGVEQSKNKKTPFFTLTWETQDGERFDDDLFLVPKAMKRLALVAKRLCGWGDDMQLPDDDNEAVKALYEHISDKIGGVRAIVTIETQIEKYMPSQGPDAGRMIEKKKRKVAFNGYNPVPEGVDTNANTETGEPAPTDDRDHAPTEKEPDLSDMPF